MIGEWFVVSQLTASPAFAQRLRCDLTDEQAATALTFLARAADWLERAGPLFGEFAAGDISRQIEAAAQAALSGEVGRHLLDRVVAEQVMSSGAEWTLDQIQAIQSHVPEHVLLRTRAAIAELLVTVYRRLAADNPDTDSPHLASALVSLGVRLDRLGRHQEALNATTEAITLYRTLATDNPNAHNPGLADSLAHLGVLLVNLDRHQEALEARIEAVQIYHDLADRDPELYQAEYRRLEAALRRDLAQAGREQEAIMEDFGREPEERDELAAS